MKLLRVPLCVILCLAIGLGFQWTGARLNRFVVTENMEQMPVWIFNDAVAAVVALSTIHKPIDKTTRYTLFADIIPMQSYSNAEGFTISSAISIGDVMIWGGIFISFLGNAGLCVLPFWLLWKGRHFRYRILKWKM